MNSPRKSNEPLDLSEDMFALLYSLEPKLFRTMTMDLKEYQQMLKANPALCTKPMPELMRDHIIDNLRSAGILID